MIEQIGPYSGLHGTIIITRVANWRRAIRLKKRIRSAALELWYQLRTCPPGAPNSPRIAYSADVVNMAHRGTTYVKMDGECDIYAAGRVLTTRRKQRGPNGKADCVEYQPGEFDMALERYQREIE